MGSQLRAQGQTARQMREAKYRIFNHSVPKAKLTATRCNSVRIQAKGSTIYTIFVTAELSDCT